MTYLIRQIIKNLLLRANTILSRPPGQFNVPFIKLMQAKTRGLQIGVAVDGGAATGLWTRQFKMVFPDADVVCIEPRASAQAALQKMSHELKGIHLIQTLIGDKEGTMVLHEHGDQSSILGNSQGRSFGESVNCPVDTLDNIMQKLHLPFPDLIKLDLQGGELVALSGSRTCLEQAQAVLLEVSFIPFQSSQPLLSDVLTFMLDHGYHCYDICSLCHRPLDGALAQGDFMFLRSNHPLLSDHRWAENSEWT